MANEKLMILKMLEDGKITSAEAVRLLDSVDNPSSGSAPPPPQPRIPDMPSASGLAGLPPPSPPLSSGVYANNGPPPPRSSASSASGTSSPTKRGIEDFASDVGRKFESFAKDLEPKLHKMTETVAEKTVQVAEKISKSLSPDPASARGQDVRPAPPPPKRPAPPPTAAGYEKHFELVISPGVNELNLSGLNGEIRIKGYNGDKLSAQVSYKPRRGNADIEIKKLGGRYFLSYEEDDFERVAIDAYVPERLFQTISINGINGNMDISSLAAEQIQISNANGQTKLAALAAITLKADCSNGRLTLDRLAAESASIENFNGFVDASELDIARMSLINFNGALTFIMSSFTRYSEYIWAIETSNAKMTVNLPTFAGLAYHVKAHTTLGDIRLGLTGMQFIINDTNLVEARSTSYDSAARKVKIAAETSNGALTIN